MKNIEEIKKTPGMIIKKQGKDGFGGTVFPIEYKNGKVKIINDIDKATKLLEDNNIKKLMYNAPYKWNFNADSWSYCKGDTYNDVCVILTSNLNKITSNDFSIKGISQKTIHMLYVAMTRTKKDLYIINNDIFRKISDAYKKV